MLWSTLWSKLGKQPMTRTNHFHVKAVVDGKTMAMELKFDAQGLPYLVPDGKHDPDKRY